MYARNRLASGAIGAHLIVKGTATDGVVSQAAAGTDKIVGVADQFGAADAARLDVIHDGPAKVVAGGAIAFGDRLTSDGNGKAVVAADGDYILGTAMENGVLNDIIEALVELSKTTAGA